MREKEQNYGLFCIAFSNSSEPQCDTNEIVLMRRLLQATIKTCVNFKIPCYFQCKGRIQKIIKTMVFEIVSIIAFAKCFQFFKENMADHKRIQHFCMVAGHAVIFKIVSFDLYANLPVIR